MQQETKRDKNGRFLPREKRKEYQPTIMGKTIELLIVWFFQLIFLLMCGYFISNVIKAVSYDWHNY